MESPKNTTIGLLKQFQQNEDSLPVSAKLNTTLQALTTHLAKAIKTYTEHSSSHQHKKYVAEFISKFIPADLKKIDETNAYYLLFSLKKMFEYFATQWAQQPSQPVSPKGSPMLSVIKKGLSDQ